MKRYLWLAALLLIPCAWFIRAQQSPSRTSSKISARRVQRTFATRKSRSFSAAAARLDAWQVLGPGGGGAQFVPAISPLDPSLIFVACDMGGAYVSTDGGTSWRQFNLGSRVQAFVFDPSNADIAYALGAQLFRTNDRGATWTMVYPDPKAVTEVRYSDDDAGRLVLTRMGLTGAGGALAIDPQNSDILYAAFARSMMMSKDRGLNWTELGTFPIGSGMKIYIDPKSPKDRRTVYLITRDRICVFENGQYRMAPPADPGGWFSDAAGAFAPSGEFVAYVTFEHVYDVPNSRVRGGGLITSRDGGQTWKTVDDNLLKTISSIWVLPEYPAVQVRPDDPDTIYLSYTRLRQSSAGPDYFGLAVTENGGQTWSFPWKEAAQPAPNVHDAWLTAAFTPYWGENPLGIALSSTDRNLIITTDLGRTMRTADRGSNWQAAYSKKLDDDSFSTTGLDVTAETGLFFDPHDSNRLFLGNHDIGLLRSENGGDGWISSNQGVPKPWLNAAYSVAFDPAIKGRMWAAFSGKHGIPSWFDVHAGTAAYKGGIMFSDDGGQSWAKSNSGLPEMGATDVLVDPDSPVDQRILYASGFGAGIFKSIDGGGSWTKKNNGIAGDNPKTWRLVRDQNGLLYAIVARFKVDGTVGGPNDGALYVSSDKAESWNRIALPEGVNGPLGLAIDPQDSNRLYLACWPRGPLYTVGTHGGVWRSSDGGKSWKNVFSRGQYIWDVTVDSENPKVIYAAGWQSSIWKSIDGGHSWNRIPGFNYARAYKVVPDPRDHSHIFVVTGGAGLWYGPADGDPQSPEDVILPKKFFPGL